MLPFLLVAAAILLQIRPAAAQLTVDISIKRTIYIAYEPLLVTVRITNLTGNRLLLADIEGKKWFGFQIQTLDGRPIPPMDANYEIQPIQIGSGESITRTVNLTQLYPLTDFGSYRIQASVYAAQLSDYFSSPPMTVEITEGHLMWQQTVGVPGSAGIENGTRTISLLSHRLSDRTDLYLRIEDKNAGIVYCTHRLGDFISYGKPEIQLDSSNAIHILQNNVPREFIYSKVGLDGKVLDRMSFQAPKDRPRLAKAPDGSVCVLGGVPFDPHATPTPGLIPKLSERPVALPTPEQEPSPAPKGGSKGRAAATPRSVQAPKAPMTANPGPSVSPANVD